jgi:hypothetical protein
MLDHIVYMPVNSFISPQDIKLLANRMNGIIDRYLMYIKQIETQQAKAEKTSQRFEEEIHLSKL